MTDTLPSSWSKREVCESLHLSSRTIDRLIREGKVSFYKAGRSQRFLVEHIGQIVASLEVKPKPPVADTTSFLGLTAQSAARRRRRVAS